MYKAADNVALMLNVNAERPLQAQLFEQVRAMIIDGQLKAGTALPATRALSERLGVSRNTVVLAYDRLLAEGYIESKRSIGTFVSTVIPDSGLLLADNDVEPDARPDEEISTPGLAADVILARHGALRGAGAVSAGTAAKDESPLSSPANRLPSDRLEYDFRPFTLDAADFPLRSWRRILNRKAQDIEHLLSKDEPVLGHFDLRRAIADHLGPARGILTSADEVMILNNKQEARLILSELLITPGAPVLCETPAPAEATALFAHKGGRLQLLPMDEAGLITEALPRLEAEAHGGGLIYVMPFQQVPLGTTMPLARRIELLEWAKAARMMVIEDEASSDFHAAGSPPTALKGLDGQGSVIYLGGFEKTLGAAAGLSYLILPKKLVGLAAKLKAMLAPGPALLTQLVLAELLECGAYDRHLRKFRKKCMEKRKYLIDQLNLHLNGAVQPASEGGLVIALTLPDGIADGDALCRFARQQFDLGIYTLEAAGFTAGDAGKGARRQLLLGFTGLEMDEISEGAALLGRLMRESRSLMSALNGEKR